MSKARGEMRAECSREDLGKGIRGKHFKRYSKGRNLVRLTDEAAKVFPTTEAVNEALLELLALTKQPSRLTSRSSRTARKAAA